MQGMLDQDTIALADAASTATARAAGVADDDAALAQLMLPRIAQLFASGIEQRPFEEIWLGTASDPRVYAAGREAVDRALQLLEETNDVMYREGVVH